MSRERVACGVVYSVTGSAVSLAGCVSCHACVIVWLAVCDRIVPGACRIMSDRVTIVFRVDAEIGESGIVRHYRR